MYQTRDKAEYTDYFGYVNRINAYWFECDTASFNLNEYKWAQSLAVVARELSTQMTSTEKEEIFNEVVALQTQVAGKNMDDGGIKKELYIRLNTLELKLRHIFKDAGLQMKVKDEPGFALK